MLALICSPFPGLAVVTAPLQSPLTGCDSWPTHLTGRKQEHSQSEAVHQKMLQLGDRVKGKFPTGLTICISIYRLISRGVSVTTMLKCQMPLLWSITVSHYAFRTHTFPESMDSGSQGNRCSSPHLLMLWSSDQSVTDLRPTSRGVRAKVGVGLSQSLSLATAWHTVRT